MGDILTGVVIVSIFSAIGILTKMIGGLASKKDMDKIPPNEIILYEEEIESLRMEIAEEADRAMEAPSGPPFSQVTLPDGMILPVANTVEITYGYESPPNHTQVMQMGTSYAGSDGINIFPTVNGMRSRLMPQKVKEVKVESPFSKVNTERKSRRIDS